MDPCIPSWKRFERLRWIEGYDEVIESSTNSRSTLALDLLSSIYSSLHRGILLDKLVRQGYWPLQLEISGWAVEAPALRHRR